MSRLLPSLLLCCALAACGKVDHAKCDHAAPAVEASRGFTIERAEMGPINVYRVTLPEGRFLVFEQRGYRESTISAVQVGPAPVSPEAAR